MQFLYDENAGENELFLKNENFHHLKVRRVKTGESLNLRNLNDDFLYTYVVKELSRSFATLALQAKTRQNAPIHRNLNLAVGVIEPKSVEKILPFLNELGLKRLIFVFTQFSQKNFIIDEKRLKRILIGSCEQCGRADLMNFEYFESVSEFTKAYPKTIMVDFSAENDDFGALSEDEVLFIGAEGGFSANERELFKRKIRLKSPYILRSQSALCAIAAKILL